MIQSGRKMASETERVRRLMDKGAPRYDRQMNFFDRALFGGGREWSCSKAEGDVLEIAVGSGRNLPFYGEGTALVGIEFSSEMLELAKRRQVELGSSFDLRLGDAQKLQFEDQSFDTVICGGSSSVSWRTRLAADGGAAEPPSASGVH